jgi:hypothetical protein
MQPDVVPRQFREIPPSEFFALLQPIEICDTGEL